jgi:hypothetical protein
MTLQGWIVRIPGEQKLRDRFYSTDSGPIAPTDKFEICRRLGITLTPDTLFETSFSGADESFFKSEPYFTGENGRKFWVYRMDDQLPI